MTFLSVVILDVDYGLFIGLGTSIIMVILRDQMTPLKFIKKSNNQSNFYRENFVLNDLPENGVSTRKLYK